jgi:GT2 family glycosyltransferase
VLVAEAGTDNTADVVRGRGPNVRLFETDDIGVAGRNVAAAGARGDLLLMLDDDSYPLPGAIETLRDSFARDGRLGVAGGLIRDVDPEGAVIRSEELGTFDWFLRAGATGAPGAEGFPAFFFPEGGCMIRRSAYEEVGGFFEPYFFTLSELDLATRMVGAGWDVRYFPQAEFDHMKAPAGGSRSGRVLRFRIRNEIWYFWLRYPAALAARRIPAYLAFGAIEAAYRGSLRAWAEGVAQAWKERDRVRAYRRPLPRDRVRRAELNRGRMHLRLLAGQLARRARR